MINVDKLKEVKNQSYEFLVMAYWLSENKWTTGLSFKEAFDELKWDYEIVPYIEEFLRSEGLIKRMTGGRIEGSFHLTHSGIVEVEEMIVAGNIVATITEDDEGDVQKVDMRDKIIEKQEQRADFLMQIFEACEGSSRQWVTIRPIAEAMGLTEREAYGLEQYLEGAYLLERLGGGGWNGSIGLTDWGVQRIRTLLLNPTDSSDGIRTKQTRGPNADTIHKLEELRKMRLESINDDEVTLGWVEACQQVGIDPDTAKKHEPELRKCWYDASYN